MTAPAPGAKPLFTSLESLRGLFALGVAVMHHPSSFLGEGGLRMNVDFFFVLSGFVIAYSYMDRIKDAAGLRSYAALRFFRLYPLHIVIIAYCVAVALINGVASEPDLARAIVAQVFLLSSFPIDPLGLLNGPAWSISAEIVVYAIFGLVLLALRGDQRLFVPAAAALSILGAVGCWLIWSDSPNDAFMDITYQFGWVRALYGFFLGVLVFALWRRAPYRSGGVGRDTLVELTLAGACAGAIVYVDKFYNSPLLIALPLLFATTVHLFAESRGYLSRILHWPLFPFLGALSYGIYLLHVPLLPLLEQPALIELGQAARAAVYPFGAIVTAVELLLYLAVVTFVAWVLHHAVERPARAWSRRRFGRPRQAGAPAAATAPAVNRT